MLSQQQQQSFEESATTTTLCQLLFMYKSSQDLNHTGRTPCTLCECDTCANVYKAFIRMFNSKR